VSRDRSVGIVRLWGGRPGFDSCQAKNIYSTPQRPARLWDPPRILSNGYRSLFSQGVNQLGRETDHSHPSSSELRVLPTPPRYTYITCQLYFHNCAGCKWAVTLILQSDISQALRSDKTLSKLRPSDLLNCNAFSHIQYSISSLRK
jgi:hypothetical protein